VDERCGKRVRWSGELLKGLFRVGGGEVAESRFLLHEKPR
jgi:hypothetical protein